MSWLKHTVCRACGFAKPTGPPGIKAVPSGEKLVPVFSLLGLQPLANAFAKADEPQSAFYPLEVLWCPRCGLAQLSATVPADVLYKTYAYVTSNSETMKAHFSALWDALKQEGEPSSVVEIGSNDGRFLAFAKEHGAMVCGIDPAQNLAHEANLNGLQTFCGVFDDDTANMARGSMPPVNLIIARHVFCHVDDWRGFVKSLEVLATKDTLMVIEVPYVLDMLKNCEWDTVYHEHTSYLSLKAMEWLLRDSPFHLHKVLRFPIHGGAIAIMLRHNQSGVIPHESVSEMLAAEDIAEKTWKDFSDAARNRIWGLDELVKRLRGDGKTVVGYGASAKATVWLNALKFTRKEIAFVCDSTPQKQWRFVPGTDIQVMDEGALLRELPDYAIMWCWNFADECIKKNARWIEQGGHFIVPIPTLKIVPHDNSPDLRFPQSVEV